MRFTYKEREQLIKSLARGVRSVRYADRLVEYHSISAMLDLLNKMDIDLMPRRSRVVHLYSAGKGL